MCPPDGGTFGRLQRVVEELGARTSPSGRRCHRHDSRDGPIHNVGGDGITRRCAAREGSGAGRDGLGGEEAGAPRGTWPPLPPFALRAPPGGTVGTGSRGDGQLHRNSRTRPHAPTPHQSVHPPVRPHPETSIASCCQAPSLVLLPSPPPLAHRGPITTTRGCPGVDPARHRGPRQ